MRQFLCVPLVMVTALLAGCGQPQGPAPVTSTPPDVTQPTAPTRSLGRMEVTFSGVGTQFYATSVRSVGSGLHGQALTSIAGGLQLRFNSKGSMDVGTPGSGSRYLYATYDVRNANGNGTVASTTPHSNLTFVAVDAMTPATIPGSAIRNLKRFDGSPADPTLATQILPLHGMMQSSGRPVVNPSQADFMAFTEAEASSFGPLTGVNSVLPYGFVVRHKTKTDNRTLDANPAPEQFDGQVTFSVKLPLQATPQNDPYSFSMVFEVVEDSETRITKTAEETLSAAQARAAALSATQVAAESVCTVRVTGSAGNPTTVLTDIGVPNGGPDGCMSQLSDITVGTPTQGPTPFISRVPLSGESIKNVVEYRYIIAPKVGAVSKPVNVSYTSDALVNKGYYSAGASSSLLPVFGLYSGRTNRVDLQIKFRDNSVKNIPLDISTSDWVDPDGIYDHINVIKQRSAVLAGDINYIFLKSRTAGPVVIDSDAEVRWVAPANINAISSTFSENRFVIGSPSSLAFDYMELDGSRSSAIISPSAYYTNFHHNVEKGKSGFLGELDAVRAGISSPESVIVDFNQNGTLAKEWDFVDILGDYMRQHGDDPTQFIRPGIDWFHSNSAIYDSRDDSVIVSSRENFVIKIDYTSGQIVWILGDPNKYWYTFPSLRAKAIRLDAGSLYPIGQHALSITPDGKLMLFNNGGPSFNQPQGAPVGDSRAYSAVSVYEIDPLLLTAQEVRRFDYNQSISSDICSSAYSTAGGSLIINYAAASNRAKVRTVGLDASGEIAFDFEFMNKSICGSSWNAELIPLDSIKFN